MEFSIIQIQPEYLSGIVDLFWNIFRKKVTIQELEKKYFNHPLAIQGAGFLALNDRKKVIAFCGAVVCQLQYGRKKALALQFGDTMTLPQYQRQGLFKKLSQSLENWAIQKGIRIHFGFLNEHSYWAYTKKLNWTIIGRMERYTIPIKTIPLQKIAETLPFLHPFWKQYVNWIIPPKAHFKQMPNSLAAENGIYLIHDKKFYQLKSNHYHLFLELKQSSYWLKLHRGLWIGDMSLQEDVAKTINKLKYLAQKCGIHTLQLQLFAGTENQKKLNLPLKSHQSWHIGGRSFDDDWPIEELILVLGDLDTF